jgi:SAM-dependent methyltransferase
MTNIINLDLDQFDGMFGLLSYHVPYLKQFCSEYNVSGKDVLEVGGAMPHELVIDYLQANSWTCTEDPSYDLINGKLGNQQSIRKNNTPRPNNYSTILKNIEDFDDSLNEKFDCIFSIACFEHISKFPEALDKMWSLLKKDGKLFTMFSPIWSSSEGHHLYHIKIPDRFTDKFPSGTKVLSDWEHLLKDRKELHSDLKSKYDSEFADYIVYHVYNNPHINRFFCEDYEYFFQLSKFKLDKFFGSYNLQITHEIQVELERKHPGYRSFSNMGIYAFISK